MPRRPQRGLFFTYLLRGHRTAFVISRRLWSAFKAYTRNLRPCNWPGPSFEMMKAPAQHLFKNLSAANPELHNDSRGRVDVRVCRPNTSRRGICSRSYHTTSSQLASFAFHQIGNPPYCPVELFKLPNPRDAVGFGCWSWLRKVNVNILK